MLQLLHQHAALFPGEAVGLFALRQSQTAQQHRYHAAMHQPCQNIAHIAVGILPDVPQDTGVQLLLIQCRLQVDDQL